MSSYYFHRIIQCHTAINWVTRGTLVSSPDYWIPRDVHANKQYCLFLKIKVKVDLHQIQKKNIAIFSVNCKGSSPYKFSSCIRKEIFVMFHNRKRVNWRVAWYQIILLETYLNLSKTARILLESWKCETWSFLPKILPKGKNVLFWDMVCSVLSLMSCGQIRNSLRGFKYVYIE